jgi:thiamine biosynthesis lipoprotein
MSATHTERAWSCAVRLVVDDERVLRHAAGDLHTLLLQVDSAASRFRSDSALSYANAHAGRPVAVSRLLADLVDAALRVAEHTGGAVDPTIGHAMRAIGYDRDIRLVHANGPSPTTVHSARTWRDVRLVRSAGLLRVPAGTALDLGATAKAYTADLAARTLARRYDTAVLVELGGDIAVAGARAHGWRVRVAEQAGGAGQLVSLRAGGLATSTTTVRRWRRAEQIVHHIVDPRTGAPTRGTWRTASVAAVDAVHANAASTAAIVLGADAVPWLEEHGYAARLVAGDGSVHLTAGWPTVGTAAA